jgi:hypothetical protein
MAIITTNGSFGATAAVTSTTLNAVADAATFDDPVDGTSLELKGDGKLGIKDAGVTKTKIENISAPLRVLGRTTAGAGVAEEVTINDDDDLSSASAITLATDESIKAYIDKFKPNIVQAVKTNIFSILTPSMVFTDIPDLEVTITPKFSNSKILISSTVNSSNNSGSHGTIFRYVKDGSAIALGDTRGNRTPCTFGSGYGGQYITDVAGMDYLDSGSLTAGTPIVYKLQVTSVTTIDVLINEVNTDNNNDYIPSPISTLTVTEIYQ